MTWSPVVPITRWETDRQDLNDVLEAMVTAFQAVVPNVVRRVWTEIPSSFTGEVPLVYLGEITEAITHDSGLRITTYSGTVEYIDSSPDNEEANTRSNTFADYFRELFTANARVNPNGLLQQVGLREGSESQGPLTGFMHLTLDYTMVMQQGRS